MVFSQKMRLDAHLNGHLVGDGSEECGQLLLCIRALVLRRLQKLSQLVDAATVEWLELHSDSRSDECLCSEFAHRTRGDVSRLKLR